MLHMLFAAIAYAMIVVQPASAEAQAGEGAPALKLEDLEAQLREKGQVTLSRMNLVIERADFDGPGGKVEAIVTRPSGNGRQAGILTVPGHGRTAFDMLPQAIRFARAGFVVMSVSQPGYGGSAGPADFAGPRTFAALNAAAGRLAALPGVDPDWLGVYGYSRGALAAAELATRTDLFRAAVLGGGIYDFRSALGQVTNPAIRGNMEAEAGLGDEAIRFRSPVLDVDGLDGPVLVIHGDADENAPVAQAILLGERLAAAGQEHELRIIAGGTHALGMQDVVVPAVAFFTKHLGSREARSQ